MEMSDMKVDLKLSLQMFDTFTSEKIGKVKNTNYLYNKHVPNANQRFSDL